jgi:omega-6 fatty acid desaturase (delta-12 desaturase)
MHDLRLATTPYRRRNNRRAATSLLTTLAAYLGSLAALLLTHPAAPFTAALAAFNALAAVRLYVLQHDCGHDSLFTTRRWNDLAGYALSTYTLTPYRAMQRNHARHHAHVGNLDARDSGEIHTMTLREWQAAPPLRRIAYRLYRHPALMLPLGGLFTYALRYRWPRGTTRATAPGVLMHDAAVLLWLAHVWQVAGLRGLALHALTVMLAGSVGVFIVYLQHNFDGTAWSRPPAHDARAAGFLGSSSFDLGPAFDLATANIAWHDLQHLDARIPSYNLRACHRALRRRFPLPRLGWRAAFQAFTLKLWDEDKRRLVPFPDRLRHDLAGLVLSRPQPT